MANIKGGVINSKAAVSASKGASPLSVAIGSDAVKKRFEEMLGKRSSAFLSSVLTVVNNNKLLAAADPKSILAAAATAASLDLSVNPSLGQAWLVPYKGACQFQVSARGLTQLAIRSNVLEDLDCMDVHEGELIKKNRFKGEYEFDEEQRTSDVVIGYYAYFKTINGFRKSVYWTRDDVMKHAKRFSKAYNSGPWQTDFDAMARKTVLKDLLLHWAPLSLDMQTALDSDNKVINTKEDGTNEYIDIDADSVGSDAGNTAESDTVPPMVDVETGELFQG